MLVLQSLFFLSSRIEIADFIQSKREYSMRGLFLIEIIIALVGFNYGLEAGGRDDALFTLDGKRVFGEPSTEVIQVFPRLATTCGSVQPCASWKLVVDSVDSESLVIDQITEALSLWTESEFLNLAFNYTGASTEKEIPYLLDGSNRATDIYENEIIEGDFVISLNPPEDVLESLRNQNAYTESIQYILPNLETGEGELLWSGVYINPDFLPAPYGNCNGNDCIGLSGDSSLSLKSIVAFSVGQSFLGLSPSGIRKSIMYPVQKNADGRVFSEISLDDLAWLNFLYPSEALFSSGEITGILKDGLDGSFLEGGHVTAVSSEILDQLVAGENISFEDYIVSGAVVQKEGKFRIRVPEGDYILFVESLDGNALRPDFFGQWVKYFGSNRSFLEEFYEGEGRESNLETWDSSLATLVLSAQISVFENEVSDNVVFYTNEPSAAQNFFASGATNETLSSVTLADLELALREAQERDQSLRQSQSSGCQLTQATSSAGFGFHFISLFLICLMGLAGYRTIFKS